MNSKAFKARAGIAGTLVRSAPEGVTDTQPTVKCFSAKAMVYSQDADALIAASQVIAIHFQTVAAANDHWRKP